MEDRFISMAELPDRLGICERSVRYLRERGEFPQPRQITKQRRGWLLSEVNEWMKARPVVGSGMGVCNEQPGGYGQTDRDSQRR